MADGSAQGVTHMIQDGVEDFYLIRASDGAHILTLHYDPDTKTIIQNYSLDKALSGKLEQERRGGVSFGKYNAVKRNEGKDNGKSSID